MSKTATSRPPQPAAMPTAASRRPNAVRRHEKQLFFCHRPHGFSISGSSAGIGTVTIVSADPRHRHRFRAAYTVCGLPADCISARNRSLRELSSALNPHIAEHFTEWTAAISPARRAFVMLDRSRPAASRSAQSPLETSIPTGSQPRYKVGLDSAGASRSMISMSRFLSSPRLPL